jgi:hypothetical protein
VLWDERGGLVSKSVVGGIPDLRWINRHVAVRDVAHKLGLVFDAHGNIHCWHPDRHQHGDRTASVSIHRTGKRLRCFGCNTRSMRPVDLVLDVLGNAGAAEVTNLADAATWIAERFAVPLLARRKHLKDTSRPPYLVGHERGVGRLIRSGLWSDLSAPAQAIAPVLWEFSQWDSQTATATILISYRGMARYAGIVSPNSISRALGELEDLGWLRRVPAVTRGAIRATSSYLITPESDSLAERAGARYEQSRIEIDTERELRSRQRTERKKTIESAQPERCIH